MKTYSQLNENVFDANKFLVDGKTINSFVLAVISMQNNNSGKKGPMLVDLQVDPDRPGRELKKEMDSWWKSKI